MTSPLLCLLFSPHLSPFHCLLVGVICFAVVVVDGSNPTRMGHSTGEMSRVLLVTMQCFGS